MLSIDFYKFDLNIYTRIYNLTLKYITESDDTYTYGDGSSKGNSIFGIYDENGIFRRVSLPVPVPQTRDRSLSFSFGETE